MSPSELPQQRLVPVVELEERPVAFDAVVGFDVKPPGVALPKGPSNAEYLGQVEWAWSPRHVRLDAYYLSRGRKDWMLWIYHEDEFDSWVWLPVGYVPKKQASDRQAAIHLLLDFWRLDREESDLDCYHWINEGGLLTVADLDAIARQVWPEKFDFDTNGKP